MFNWLIHRLNKVSERRADIIEMIKRKIEAGNTLGNLKFVNNHPWKVRKRMTYISQYSII